ncbi:MAG TPA: pyridoxal-phosphate dependent enzyme [Gemmatimonadales bacterium]|nr:pyridoxal-phosphate dependent enzyme [Gemmatimonadales bacterium]
MRVAAAAADGRLAPGGTVVEYTAGTKGSSLALICAARGYNAHFVFTDAFSDEKRWTMRAYGAELTDVASDQGTITARLIKALIATAGEISRCAGVCRRAMETDQGATRCACAAPEDREDRRDGRYVAGWPVRESGVELRCVAEVDRQG